MWDEENDRFMNEQPDERTHTTGDCNGRNRKVVKKNGRFAHVMNCGYIQNGWSPNFMSPTMEMRDIAYG